MKPKRHSKINGPGQYPRKKGSRSAWHGDAIEMFKAGRSQADIAAKHGVSRERVNQVLVMFGGHKPRVRPEVTLNKILTLYESDKCIDEIAKKLGKDFFYVVKVLKRAGVSLDPIRRRARHRMAVSLASEGKTVAQISKAIGMSIGVVFYVLRRYMKPEKFSVLLEKGEKFRVKNSADARRREADHA